MGEAPRIVFSYAGDDDWWVEIFKSYFKVGVVQIVPCGADIAAFGPLKEALDEQIEHSAVVVAFVSQKYTKKVWTVAEWEKSLSEAQRRRLIFVPIMLEADAIVWWQTLRRDGKLTALSVDYQYVDFTGDGSGFAVPSLKENPEGIRTIAKLAEEIRKQLARTVAAEEIGEKPTGTKEPPTEKDRKQLVETKGADEIRVEMPGTKETGQSGSGRGPSQGPETSGPEQQRGQDTPQVVILGHPTASLPSDIRAEVKDLTTAMAVSVVPWKDGWREPEAKACRSIVGPDASPIFVQPIPKAEARDYAADRLKTNTALKELGCIDPRVTIWLPEKFHDPSFCGDSDPVTFPTLRTDSPANLAQWLSEQFRGAVVEDAMILQVQGIGSAEDTKPETAAQGQLMIDQLINQMWNIVSVVKKPRPTPPPWPFWDTLFRRQLEQLPGSRAVVAVHDLDIAPNPDRKAVRKKVELKFDRILRDVETAQQLRKQKGDPKLKVFCTALLVNNAEHLPFTNYPDDGRYKDWRILGFPTPEGGGTKGALPPPDPASLAVFRSNLYAWAATL